MKNMDIFYSMQWKSSFTVSLAVKKLHSIIIKKEHRSMAIECNDKN